MIKLKHRVGETSVNMPSFPNFSILADLPPEPGYTKPLSYCVKITNQEKYPNYLLFLQIGSANSRLPRGPYRLIKAGECVPISGGYRPVATISAIAKDKVQPEDLEDSNQGKILDNIKLQKDLIEGNLAVGPPLYVPVRYGFSRIVDNVQIESVNPNSLQLSVKQEFQPPLNWIVLIVGVAILGWVIWRKRRRTE